MLRFVGIPMERVLIQDLYLAKEDVRISLVPFLGYGTVKVFEKKTEDEARFFFSVQLLSEDILKSVLPCTIGCISTIDDLSVNTGTYLMLASDSVTALVPSAETTNGFSLQPINVSEMAYDTSAKWVGGRICEMLLTKVGASSGGFLWEVNASSCVPAAGMRCPTTCESGVGTVLFFPDDIGTITGQN
jgi:hypothetical protein